MPVIDNPANRPGISLKNHVLLGTWKYMNTYTREFHADGRCILRNGKDVIWTKKAASSTKNSVTLEGGYTHVLNGDTLNIEGRYKATRK